MRYFVVDHSLMVFVKVVEKQNFSKAANELHMTQPAVSQYIKSLEENLGTRLLERSNKYVRLNQAGELVYSHAKEILALYSKMKTSVDELTTEARGSLSIGASYTFGEYILPRIISTLRKKYPLITPTVKIHNTKQIIELVAAHQIDIGIIEGTFHDEKLYTEAISNDEMLIVSSPLHPQAKKGKGRRIAELENETWILREKGSGTRQAAEKLFEMYQMAPKNIMEFGSTQLIKESVEQGLGISLLSSWAIEKERQNDYLDIIPVIELPFKRTFYTVTQTIYQTKTLKTFIDTLKDSLKQEF